MTGPSRSGGRNQVVLTLATQWSGANGGHTINRELSGALAEQGHTVVARVSEAVFEGEDQHPGLTVSGLEPIPGIDPNERANLLRTDGLPKKVDVVVGHGRFTGGAAEYLRDNQYPQAHMVHVVHALVGTLDVARTQFEDQQTREAGRLESLRHEQTELQLTENADLVVGVGPLLTQYAQELASRCEHPPPVYEMVPGVTIHQPVTWPAQQSQVNLLLVGRTDDPIKGADIAAGAVRMLHERGYANVRLTLRGAKPETLDQGAAYLSELAGSKVEVRPFTTSGEELAADIRGADLVLMPSRNEGFGLVATEAAGHGAPVLMSGCSGAGMFFKDPNRVPPGLGDQCVVPMTGDEPQAYLSKVWADRIESVTTDLPGTRQRALQIHQHLAGNCTWDKVAKDFAAQLDKLPARDVGSNAAQIAGLGFLPTTQRGSDGIRQTPPPAKRTRQRDDRSSSRES